MPVAANERGPSVALRAGGLLLSVGVHAATFVSLGALPADAPRIQEDVVELTVVEEPAELAPPAEPAPAAAEPAPPEPPPEPVKAPPKPVARAPKPAKTPPPPPDKTPPAAAEEQIADFSGTTLTGQGGWASAVGSGAPMNAPIGSASAVTTGRERAGTPGGVVGGTGTRVVGPGDLSRQPVQPAADVVNAALERSYPKAARQQGLEGVARIRVRVLASGRLQPLATVSETQPGFAEACRRSLRELTFQPGLDRAGQPVATDITYTCRLTVD